MFYITSIYIISVTPKLIKVTHHVPHHPYSRKKKMCKGTTFVIFEFIVLHRSRDKTHLTVLNAFNLAQYNISKSN